jgi:hypothetical protein
MKRKKCVFYILQGAIFCIHLLLYPKDGNKGEVNKKQGAIIYNRNDYV